MMKPFSELSEHTILKRACIFIHDYKEGLELEEDCFDERLCLERALETIRDYYCQRHGIRYLERPTDVQIRQMDEAVERFTPAVRQMVSEAHLRYGKLVAISQINTVRVQTLLVPALMEAGYEVHVDMDGKKKVGLSVFLATGQYSNQSLRITLRLRDELTPGYVTRLIGEIRNLEAAIARFAEVSFW